MICFSHTELALFTFAIAFAARVTEGIVKLLFSAWKGAK